MQEPIILISGSNGLVGQYLHRALLHIPAKVIATGRESSRLGMEQEASAPEFVQWEITDPQQVSAVLKTHRPNIIIHAAAEAQPDFCEQNREAAWQTNVAATRYIAEVAEEIGAFMLFVSTDFVFKGDAGPYKETDLPDPVNYYGETKREAEQLVQQICTSWAIVRTVLVYGKTADGTRSNIITWLQGHLEKGNPIKVVNDQVRTPTYAGDLAKGILAVALKKAGGIWHISGKDELTPYQMGLKVAERLNLPKELMTPVTADTFTQPAVRPLKTGFDIYKAENELGYAPISFEEGINIMIRNLF
ncbi:MAG: SDR family oxidoreductase [Chitinophagaceae bacterium]